MSAVQNGAFSGVKKGQWVAVQYSDAQAPQPFQVRWVQAKEQWLVLDPKPSEAFDGKRLRYYDWEGNALGTAEGHVVAVYTSEADVAKAVKAWAKEVHRQAEAAKAAAAAKAEAEAKAAAERAAAVDAFRAKCQTVDASKVGVEVYRTPDGTLAVVVTGADWVGQSFEALYDVSTK